jgi:hypothetical protein
MHSVVSLFPTREMAEKAARSLNLPDRVSVVAPAPRRPEDAGLGEALGGVVGGSLGIAAGSTLAPVTAALLLPGVGPLVAIGVGALVLGAGGTALGVAAGKKVEEASEPEHQHDPHDVFFYHEALRRGRAIVLALAENKEEADSIRRKLASLGAQDLDAAREEWWRDIRETERAAYQGDFAADEQQYRLGFEAALSPANRGKRLDDNGNVSSAYRRGYERGYEYLSKLSPAV